MNGLVPLRLMIDGSNDSESTLASTDFSLSVRYKIILKL